jgi:hypothetical protein
VDGVNWQDVKERAGRESPVCIKHLSELCL